MSTDSTADQSSQPWGPPPRLTWHDLPATFRAEIEQAMSAQVVTAQSQVGGFSPGSADRVQLSDGRRAFIKTVAATANADSISIHRRELQVLTALGELESAGQAPVESGHHGDGADGPATDDLTSPRATSRHLGVRPLPYARLLASVDTGDRVAIVIEDVPGQQPTWQGDEVVRTLDALLELRRPLPATVADQLPSLRQTAGENEFRGWQRLTPESRLPYDADLNQWVRDHLAELTAMTAEGIDQLAGDSLVHRDLRADNILFRSDGRVVLVDWPWATVGSPWFDAANLIANVRLLRPDLDLEPILSTHPAFAEAPPGLIDGFLAGLAGYFTHAAHLPDIPTLPGLRQFQRAEGVATLGWLRRRMP